MALKVMNRKALTREAPAPQMRVYNPLKITTMKLRNRIAGRELPKIFSMPLRVLEMMPKCSPERAKRWAAPLLLKAFWISEVRPLLSAVMRASSRFLQLPERRGRPFMQFLSAVRHLSMNAGRGIWL